MLERLMHSQDNEDEVIRVKEDEIIRELIRVKKRKIYLITLLVVFFIVVAFFSLFLIQKYEREGLLKEPSYYVLITSNDTTNYTILLPIPKNWDSFFDIVRVAKGNANVSKSNISDGPAILIRGNGSVRIEAIGKDYISNSVVDFSWCYNTNQTTKVYSEKKPNDAELQVDVLYLDYYSPYFHLSPHMQLILVYWIDGSLNADWQWVKMESRFN